MSRGGQALAGLVSIFGPAVLRASAREPAGRESPSCQGPWPSFGERNPPFDPALAFGRYWLWRRWQSPDKPVELSE
jgi:hypothetical protein